MSAISEEEVHWSGTPGGWLHLRSVAARNCPKKSTGTSDWKTCSCQFHKYMRSPIGIKSLSAADLKRTKYMEQEFSR